ncbi:uncharacterized protein LOC134715695 [Mytilus trossulus]|uniref:uncharacterized protein LOC134715695 n=1 Tax=Mytilus trossulus TaxID=6551 RepID=UPI0030065712
MSQQKLIFILLQYVLLCSSVYCSLTLDDHSIESEGLLPAYNIVSNRDVVEGSGDAGAALPENVRLTADKCDCSNINTTPDSRVFYNSPEPLVVTSTPSVVVAIIVILSILLLICISAIAYLLGKVKYLNMRQRAPAPNKTKEDYDSDEYSVMMDWSNEPSIVINQKKNKKREI